MKNDKIQKITEYIIRCPFEELQELSVNFLAKKFGISVSHLSREFHRQENVKLSQFIQQVKITRSVHLMMTNKDLTIKEIAEKAGFVSTKHFIKIFKKYYSITPSKYRALRY